MSNRHRPTSTAAPRPWRTAVLRAVSLVAVIAIGLGVYLGVKREERQGCLNDAFRSSLDERSRATDGLIDALTELNGRLTRPGNTRAQESEAREAFGEAVGRVRADRETAKAITREQEVSDCG